ncbi:uncharacterized protein LOC131160884 [Malania oleifera]|uniref:uncharacterized protein LOC131160884 n=1 Tax=Malania oleifera TaxID=397392 RepID=UPI0025ADD697|nr:uncharacterized protein LOC131160884 [Malania oleifera]
MNPMRKDVDTRGDKHMDLSSEDDVDVMAVLHSITRHAKKEAQREQGGANLIVAEDWIQEIEELLTVLHCTEEKKVQYATFKLVGEAKIWRRSAKLVEEQRPRYTSITWSHFKEVFFGRCFPIATREAKAKEFLHLTQGSMLVQQYAAKFVELSCFAPHMVPYEPLKAWMFKKGLRSGIHAQMVALMTQSFSKLVDRAMA